MKRITRKQLDRLDALYCNGQLDGQRINDWTILSEDEGNKLIIEAEIIPGQTYQPATETLKKVLLKLIRTGRLVLKEYLLRFMSLAAAETLCWMFHSTNKNTEPDITGVQYKRIRVLIAKGFLQNRPTGEIKRLSYKAAEKLIEEGENNALQER
ncbi:MAG: hypothetical protein WC082_10270 [Victivallales bacterium]